ncbi:MAG: energy transducer TonB [Bacteroidota bacterium]
MKNIFAAILFLSFAFGFGQENTAPKEDAKLIKENATEVDSKTEYNKIFTSVHVQAQPPGGMHAFRQMIGSSFRVPVVYETTIGTVIAKFVVWDDGTIRDIQIIKETPANLGLGKEAIRVISSSEKWIPGVYNGMNVKQYYTLPIAIQITPAEKKQTPVEEAKKDKQ